MRTGAFDARDRATKRRRRVRRVEDKPSHDPHWTRAYAQGLGFDHIERLDLKQVLRETATVDVPPERRLAELGFALALSGDASSGARAWSAISRFFDAAVRLNADDPEVYALRGGAAAEIASVCQSGERELSAEAIRSMERAVQLAPTSARYRHQLGWVTYHDRERTTEEALEHFELAIQLDEQGTAAQSEGSGWSLLYRAHCLHDAERWHEAAQAYGCVPGDLFDGSGAWLRETVMEQHAWCLLESGDRGQALRMFERVLERYEAVPTLAFDTCMPFLTRAALSFPALAPRVRAVETSAELLGSPSQPST